MGQDVWQRALGGYGAGVVCRSLSVIPPGVAVVAIGREDINPGSPVQAQVITVQVASAAIRATRGDYGPYGVMVGPVPGSPENLSIVMFDGPKVPRSVIELTFLSAAGA